MQNEADTRAAIEAGLTSAALDTRREFIPEDASSIPVVLLNAGQSLHVPKDLLAELEKRRPGPRRRSGTARHTEIESFIAHVNRFKGEPSAVFADSEKFTLTAVFDYHPAGPEVSSAAWGQHRATYCCPRSKAWVLWTENDEEMMLQEVFAQFIEDHLHDLTSGKDADGKPYPQPLDVADFARRLMVTTKGTFTRQQDRRTGAYNLVATGDTETSIPVPEAFLLGIPVFDGGALYPVAARLRLHIDQGRPRLGYALHRRADIERDAFGDVRKKVAEQTSLPVFAGAPES